MSIRSIMRGLVLGISLALLFPAFASVAVADDILGGPKSMGNAGERTPEKRTFVKVQPQPSRAGEARQNTSYAGSKKERRVPGVPYERGSYRR